MSQLPRALGKMTTFVQRVFRRNPEGYYQEVEQHFIKFLNEDSSLRSTKLDYEKHLDLWKVAQPGDRCAYGDIMWKFPDQEKPVRLICIKKG